ncbi:MAG: NADH-quinone oxidoreductase subunit NuoF [Candidatus Eisenbacteria bacterium]|nr:NADH-quinone oxidoreductase subunit NuoF [Candidatus Eisenbacteria bacterium]
MEKVLTRNIRPGAEALDIEGYQRAGGYEAFRSIAGRKSPEEIVQLVFDSKLRGRGGAGFPTGLKWKAMPPFEGSARPRILACNFDEMEPGTFKDRFLVEGDPHQLIEGCLIAAYACRCDAGYIFTRYEYARAERLLEQAVAAARGAGLLGKNILGSGWDFDLHVHLSGGRYMCGEETGLLNALEGKRANPRAKPPYPPTSGAWGKPTVIQNVETLCNLPHIVRNGAEWFQSLGKAKDAGTKIYGASGRVKHPHCVELPMGTTLRELLFGEMGGMAEGYEFRAALPGGASTRFLGPEQLDVPLEFESLKEIRAFFGTGTAVVFDDSACIVDALRNLETFFARESCGWCTPCREGLPWIREILERIEGGVAGPEEIPLLEQQARLVGPYAFCALALGATLPLQSGMEMFREEFEEHVRTGTCRRRGSRA